MTNIDRAAEHLNSLDRLYAYASGNEPSNAERAQALADAGLLMPDLPEPVQDDNFLNSSVWNVRTPCEHVGVRIIRGKIRSSIVGTYGTEEAREAALALLAAADYAERNQE